jgi:periplasmic protein CpxP/Spy
MSSESPSSASTSPPPQRARRARRILVGSVLVLSGAVVGVGTTALSQDYGPRWGWHDSGPRGGYDGRRDRRDSDDDFGRRGSSDGRSGGHGWRSGHFGGELFFTPGHIERMVDRLARAVDASSEQKQKLSAVFRGAADDLYALRQKRLDGRKQIADVLTAPTIDRGKLEALRAAQMQQADAASKRLTAAVADAGDVLTPAQRGELAKRIEERHRWIRG